MIHSLRKKWYWIKCRLWHRHNVVKIKSLPPTWSDRDTILLHAGFQILVDFIEKEKPFDVIDTEVSINKKDWERLKELYNWWTVERPKRKNPLDSIDPPEGFMEFVPSEIPGLLKTKWGDSEEHKEYSRLLAESSRLEGEWYQEDTEKLKELCEIRRMLWT